MSASALRRMVISNIGAFGEAPTVIELSNLVCLVGANNSGKSTVLDCYQLAMKGGTLHENKVHKGAVQNPYVELWIETPINTPNIAEKWIKSDYEQYPGRSILRARWQWDLSSGLACERTTFDKDLNEFSTESKAAGIDSVFNSRLPKPIRISALEQPEKETLLRIVLDPIIDEIKAVERNPDSALYRATKEVQQVLSTEISRYDETIREVQNSLESQFASVFEGSKITLSVKPNENLIDIESCIGKGSDLLVGEYENVHPMKTQGTGAQRTLFWAMLKTRSAIQEKIEDRAQREKFEKDRAKKIQDIEKKIEKLEAKPALTTKDQTALEKFISDKARLLSIENEDHFKPGYLVMIDEPEIALHPAAVRSAKDQLYKLATEVGWQVMMTTHHPAFIDPTKDHTTIIRLEKHSRTAHTFRSELESFGENEKNELAALLKFDMSFGEIFFAKEVIIVEGDTEYALFQESLNVLETDRTPSRGRVVVRAGGKTTIPLLLRILRQFKIPHFVLHDVDPPRRGDGSSNGIYTVNKLIVEEIAKSKGGNISIVHRVSVPNFEQALDLPRSGGGKPLDAVRYFKDNDEFRGRVQLLVRELTGLERNSCPGSDYERLLKDWIAKNKPNDERFKFE